MEAVSIRKNRLNLRKIAGDNTIFIVFIGLLILSGLVSPVFFTFHNLRNILLQVSTNGIIALAMTFVMIGGGFDLSVGSTLSLAGVLVIGLQNIMPFGAAIAIALLVGLGIGLLNGTIMGVIKGDNGDAFMITFGSEALFAALALIYTGGDTLTGSRSAAYNFIGQGYVGVVPIPVLIFIVLTVAGQFVLSKTKFGRSVYALGGNYEASRLSGIKVDWIKAATYILTGVFSAVAAIVITSRTAGASPIQGVGYEFDAITAVILGGTSLSGGEGSIGRTFIGVLILGIISNIMNLFGFSINQQYIVKGILILLAVYIDSKKSK